MTDVMIQARGLTKKYGAQVALNRASFKLRRGEILGFLGPNGAGKSTTMKILTCFIAPTEGTATVNGCDIWDDPIGVRSAIGYLPESTPLYPDMLVFEYLEWVADMRGLQGKVKYERILKVVEDVSLEAVANKPIKELSKGYRQRVGLAQALIHEPPILILDEPMSGLDPNQATEIRSLIREIGKDRTVILSTHNLSEVQVTCSRVLIVDEGRIVADDTPEGLATAGAGPTYRLSVLKDHHLEGGELRSGPAKTSATEIFRALPKVETARSLPDRGKGHRRGQNEQRLEISATVTEDLRGELFAAAARAGLVLVHIERKRQGLEQVFQQLTAGDANAEDGGESAGSSRNEEEE